MSVFVDGWQQVAGSLSAEQLKDRRDQQVHRLRQLTIKRCQRKVLIPCQSQQQQVHVSLWQLDDECQTTSLSVGCKWIGSTAATVTDVSTWCHDCWHQVSVMTTSWLC